MTLQPAKPSHFHPLPAPRRQIDRIDQLQILHRFIALYRYYRLFTVKDICALVGVVTNKLRRD